jgi:SAM-dependent methyltransferase
MKSNFFDQGSPYLQHPLLTPERTMKEIDFILSVLDLEAGDKILDIGCGAGRHSVELAVRGFDVLGIDPSATMIASAMESAAGEYANLKFLQMKGEDIPWLEEFDVAICLFTTLGQVDYQEENQRLLFNAAQSLLPGGYFILEIPQREWLEKNLKTSERLGEGHTYTDVERSYSAEEKQVTEVFTQVSPKDVQIFILRYRLFNPKEIQTLLEKAGFADITFYGGYEKAPLFPDSPTMVISARKEK